MRDKRRGMVLILVLLALALMSLAGFSYRELMFTEVTGSRTVGRTAQARQSAASGVEAAQGFLMLSRLNQDALGGWYDNAGEFRAVAVAEDPDPRNSARYSIVAPQVADGLLNGQVRFGLESESTRIHLNELMNLEQRSAGSARKILLGLPQMTEEIADAILDWLDSDDEPREFGAEADYYAGLLPPYAPRNGNLESVEELLQVRGVTPELLYGRDVPRNFGAVITSSIPAGDARFQTGGSTSLGASASNGSSTSGASSGASGSSSGASGSGSSSGTGSSSGSSNASSSTASPDNALIEGNGGQLPTSGWAALLTIYSVEKNVNRLGLSRINVNGEDLQALFDDLSAELGSEWATFIVAYRQFGPYNPATANNGNGGGGTGNTGAANGPSGGNTGGQNAGGQSANGQSGGGQTGGGQTNTPGQGNSGQGNNTGGTGSTSGPSSPAAPTAPGPASPAINDPNPLEGETPNGRLIDYSIPATVQLQSFLDLVGVRVQTRFRNETTTVILRAQFPNSPNELRGFLPKLADAMTVNPSKTIAGRININQASRNVLLAIPGIQTEVVDSILRDRELYPAYENLDRTHETWPLAEGLLTLPEMKQMLPFVTTRGEVFRVQSVGFFDGGGPAARVEAVIDATGTTPNVVFWRDLTHLGQGFPLSTLGAVANSSDLSAGQTAANGAN